MVWLQHLAWELSYSTGAATEKKKRKETLTRAITRIKLEDIMLSDISQLPKDKYHTLPLLRGM